MKGVVDQFENGHTSVVFIGDGNDAYDPVHNVLYWDPHSALETTSGGHQSPALGLGHEMAHETGGRLSGIIRAMFSDKNYGNAEERRVIQNYETPAARHLGEGTRTDHSARSLYWVPTPTSF